MKKSAIDICREITPFSSLRCVSQQRQVDRYKKVSRGNPCIAQEALVPRSTTDRHKQ